VIFSAHSPSNTALLKLSQKLPFDLSKGSVTLVEDSQNAERPYFYYYADEGILSAWGTSSPECPLLSSKHEILQLEALDIVDASTCIKRFKTLLPIFKDVHFCGFSRTSDHPACLAEPGSPLVNSRYSHNVLLGIVSGSVLPCDTDGAPVIFVNVTFISNWINKFRYNY